MLKLIARAILGFLFLMFVLALALFLPAGSLTFWRAWVYLGVFAVCTALITIYLAGNDPALLAGRVQAGPVAESQKVVTTGPYSLVRHPMYAGAGLLVIVTPIALGSWVAMPLAAGLMLVIVVRLREEERLLADSLAGYKEYCNKVRHRLIPFIW